MNESVYVYLTTKYTPFKYAVFLGRHFSSECHSPPPLVFIHHNLKQTHIQHQLRVLNLKPFLLAFHVFFHFLPWKTATLNSTPLSSLGNRLQDKASLSSASMIQGRKLIIEKY
jgi:hypothetical protein